MRERVIYFMIVFSLLQFSCKRENQQQTDFDFLPPEVFEIKGHIVPQDKTAPPEILPVKEVKSNVICKPRVINLHSNVHTVGKPKIIQVGAPKICVPGKNGFSLPEIFTAIDSPFAAGAPEITIAKEPQINNINPSSFSTFKVLQGLKTNDIFPMMQDRAGNLWIACFEGGVCKYDGRSFTNYNTVQGLSNGNVWSMLEDSKGNFWFGTLGGGLNKFDGKLFTTYSTAQGLSDDGVISIFEDSKGFLWFGTENGGVNKYDGKTFTHYTTKQGLVANHIRTIIEDSKGFLWFAARGGISKFDGVSFSNYTAEQGLSNADVMCILRDRKDNFWFSTYGGGVNKFDGHTFENYSVEQGLPDSHVYNIMEDRTGNLWFTLYDQYVVKYDGKSFTQFGTEQGLSNSKVHSILEDKAGYIWFGTNDGLCKYNGKIFTHFNSGTLVTQKVVMTIHENKSSDIWIGTYGDGIKKIDAQSVSHYTTEQGLTDNDIMCLLNDRDDALLIGTHFGGLNKFNGNSFFHFENLPQDGIWTMLEDSKGNIWIGTSKGLYKYDGKTFTHFGAAQGLSWESIISICEDKKGNLWLGTELDGVINKLDLSGSEKGKYSFVHYDIKQGSGLLLVYSIIEDKAGNLWFGTSNSGAVKFDGKFFTRYTTAQGLSNNSVNSIVEDNSAALWFLTENGLCKMLPRHINSIQKSGTDYKQNTLFRTYLYEDGFFGVGSHYNSMILARNGDIWTGASNWLTCYHPEGDIADTIPPTILLTGITLFNETINWRELQYKKDTVLFLHNGTKLRNLNFTELTPWYNQPENLQIGYNNNITFQFIGVTINRPGEVRYRYFLEGLNDNWSAITDKPEATYNNLPPGKYTLKVKAAKSEGYWSKELNYSFTILPAWWQTWWFKLAAATCLIVSAYGVMRWRIRQKFHLQLERSEKERQLAELQQQKTELEMQALRAQMNPHFIFNSLNSINRFILQNNRMQASEYLTKFSKLVRLILQNSQAALITLESELESTRLYLDLEMLRFEEHFSFKIIVDDELDIETTKVPPLLIQPYAENAIWHGIMPKEEKGHLEIHLFVTNDMLCCKITDDGIGREKAAALNNKPMHTSMGMRITEERIAMLQQQKQMKSAVQITDLVSPNGRASGTEVLLKIPLIL